MQTAVTRSGPGPTQPAQTAVQERATADWRLLYRFAGAAALVSIACIIAAIPVYLLNPIPTSIAGWFALYQRNWLIGLFSGDLMMLLSFVAMGVIYLGLFGALRRDNEPLTLLATIAGLVSVVLYIAVNPAFSMLALSDQYGAASGATERAQLLGAGQAIITNWQGSAFDVSYLLAAIAALLIGLIMLRGSVFGPWTAYSALAFGALGLVPAAAGMVGIIASLIALAPTVVWLALIAWRFFQLGRSR